MELIFEGGETDDRKEKVNTNEVGMTASPTEEIRKGNNTLLRGGEEWSDFKYCGWKECFQGVSAFEMGRRKPVSQRCEEKTFQARGPTGAKALR